MALGSSALFTYMAALTALTLTPGPLVATLAARAAGGGRRGACALAFGICAGDQLIILAVAVRAGAFLTVIMLTGAIRKRMAAPEGAARWRRGMSVIIALSRGWITLG